MSIDTKILEQRLITKDSVRGSASITRSAEKLSALNAALGKDKNGLESFLREIMMFRLETDKSCRTYENYVNQVVEYHELQQTLAKRAADTTEDIQRFRLQLQQEKKIRAHRSICENFAETVNRHKSKSYLHRNISQIEGNVSETNKKLESISQDIKTRKVQFDSLLTALLDLESQIIQTNDGGNESDDEPCEERGQRREDIESELKREGDGGHEDDRCSDNGIGPEEGNNPMEIDD
jgi:chromosome segregation ATPase